MTIGFDLFEKPPYYWPSHVISSSHFVDTLQDLGFFISISITELKLDRPLSRIPQLVQNNSGLLSTATDLIHGISLVSHPARAKLRNASKKWRSQSRISAYAQPTNYVTLEQQAGVPFL